MFKYHNPSTEFKKKEGWQFALIHVIVDIKHDLQHKAHFVVRTHVIDSSMHRTYSSTVDMIDFPDYYLGNSFTWRGDKIHISTKNYVKEVLRKYQDKSGTIVKENLPIKAELQL
eukprot:3800560-Ditylum_brightwellii.AAC.2